MPAANHDACVNFVWILAFNAATETPRILLWIWADTSSVKIDRFKTGSVLFKIGNRKFRTGFFDLPPAHPIALHCTSSDNATGWVPAESAFLPYLLHYMSKSVWYTSALAPSNCGGAWLREALPMIHNIEPRKTGSFLCRGEIRRCEYEI